MTSPALSRKVGRILGTRNVTPPERSKVITAVRNVEEWADVSPDIRRLLIAIETRPAILDVFLEKARADAVPAEVGGAVGPKVPPALRSEDDDEPDEETWALIEALSFFDDEPEATRDAAFESKHHRGPGGKFATMVDRLVNAIAEHKAGKGEGDPFDGFDREQLRRAAKARGIELKRGEDRDSIATKLLADLGGSVKTSSAAKKLPYTKAAPGTTKGRLAELDKKTSSDARRLGGGQIGETRLLTYNDGSKVIEKIYGSRWSETPAQIRQMVDAEQLGPKVLEAVGVRAPEVISTGKGRLLMEHLDGEVGANLTNQSSWYNSPEGRRMGLADVLMANYDRNNGNWLVLSDGHLAGIDHGEAFHPIGTWGDLYSDFTSYIVTFDPVKGAVLRSGIQFDRKEFNQIRARLTALRPDFVAARRTRWYNEMMKRLATIENLLA